MKNHIRERVIMVATYVVNTNATVRKAASVFKVSKSTVWRDLVVRLPGINPELADRVREVLNANKKEQHLRGSLATRLKRKDRRR